MAIQATSEEQLRLKKRARQRLLGAATLLISAAIILPLVLDKAPRPLNSDIAINMPASTLATVKPVVVTPPPVISAPVVHSVPDNSALNQPESTGKPATAPVTVEQAHNDTTEQNNSRKANEAKSALALEKAKQAAQLKLAHEKNLALQTARAEEKAQQAAKNRQSVIQSPSSASAKSDAPASAVTDSKPQSAPANSQFVVQLGAFSSPENVRQLRERLSVVGVNTYTENLPSGAIRVRAGPFAERGQADNALAKISAAGVQAQVIPLTHK